MNKEQQPQTEAEAMKAAAESWDTPVEKKETTAETVAPNAEDQMDMEIQNESAELEKNSAEVEKALVDVGGMEGLQLTLQEMPEDKKTEMVRKLKEEHEKDMEQRKLRFEGQKFLAKDALSSGFNPLDTFFYMRGPYDLDYDASVRDLNNNYFDADHQMNPDPRPKVWPAIKTVAAYATLFAPISGSLGAVGSGVKSLKEKTGMNMAERRHKKELKKLENSEA
jgi:hypothetical protein